MADAPGARSTEIVRRTAVTAGAVALLLLGERLPLPSVSESAYGFPSGPLGWSPFLSPLALGVGPFVAAFLFVELVAVAVPRLRRLRDGSPPERLRLTRAAWGLAIVAAGMQGWGIATLLWGTTGADGYPLLEGGLGSAAAVTAAISGGTLAAGIAASVVSRHGLGNGFAVLLAVGALETLGKHGLAALAQPGESWTEESLILLLALAVIVPLLLARWRRPGGEEPRVPVPTSSLVVVRAPGLIFGFPAVLAAWVPAAAPIDEALWSGDGVVVAWASPLVAVALAALLSRLFAPPGGVLEVYRRAAPDRFEAESAAAVRRALAAANRRSLAVVAGVSALPVVAWQLGAPVWIDVEALFALALVLALGEDLRTEAKARAGGSSLASAYPLHAVFAVEPVLLALAAAGIAGFARTRRFRALFQFFAPFAPVEILVPEDRKEEAEAICAAVARGARPPG